MEMPASVRRGITISFIAKCGFYLWGSADRHRVGSWFRNYGVSVTWVFRESWEERGDEGDRLHFFFVSFRSASALERLFSLVYFL